MSTASSESSPQYAALYCPFTTETHPRHEQMRARTDQWMSGYGIYIDEPYRRRMFKEDVTYLVARGLPYGLDSRMQIVFDLILWETVIDDQLEGYGRSGQSERAALAARIVHAVTTPQSTGHAESPLVVGIRDLRQRIGEAGASPVQIARWTSAISSYIFGQLLDWADCQEAQNYGVDDYLPHRINSVGVLPFIALMDFAGGFEISIPDWERPEVRALIQMTICLAAIANDIVGFHHQEPSVDLNIISLMAAENRLTFGSAMAEAVLVHNAMMQRFTRLGDAVAECEGPELRAFVESLRIWLRGNIDFTCHSQRYTAPASLASVADQARHSFDPASLPSVSWWWQRFACEELMGSPAVQV
jgi:hypothetical protein